LQENLPLGHTVILAVREVAPTAAPGCEPGTTGGRHEQRGKRGEDDHRVG
jgi:hypothetical protein